MRRDLPWRSAPVCCATLLAAVLVAALVVPRDAAAQVATDRVEGLRDNTPRLHALTGARLVIGPDRSIDNGTLLIRDGIIVAAGAALAVPAGARVWKLEGRTVYAGFIDLASALGVPASLKPPPPPPLPPGPDRPASAPAAPRPLATRALATNNPNVHPEQDLAQQLELHPEDVKKARELGFTSVLASPAAGVFRGQGALLDLADSTDPKALVVTARAAQHIANEFDHSRDAIAYPGSLMGAIALVRQTLYDARWYRDAVAFAAQGAHAGRERPAPNASLEALGPVLAARQPVIYSAEDEQAYQRIARLRDEFGLRVVVRGNGYEYRRSGAIKAAALPVIVPLSYPAAPEIENPDTALDTPLEALQHWEQAPSNLALIDQAGVEFALTAAGLPNAAREFWPRLRQAVKRGLPAARALAGLTTVPARLIGEQARLGTLEAGRIANLVVARGDLFNDDKAVVELVFVDGRPYPAQAFDRFDPRGTWSVASGAGGGTWVISGAAAKPVLLLDGASCALSVRGRELVLRLPCQAAPAAAGAAADRVVIVAEGRGDAMRGSSQTADGALTPWSAIRTGAFTDTAPAPPPEVMPPPWPASYPAGAFGIAPPPRPALLLVRNATLWTSAAAGRLETADLLVRDGRIAAVGVALPLPAGAMLIDATGKHVTPGIVDAHSHTAILGGFNEATSSVAAEVRVGDVVDATDINLYRELAGGVTAANLLHGSADTIGGQNQVIKLRWGADAEALKFEGAMPGIKFALGENVKQSNWGERFKTRYPQTRMGVEQILRDALAAARSHADEREAWRRAPAGRLEPRRDLQLEALAEVLERKRLVHIHSYRQDEILMFSRLARELGIGGVTFQHVLEGYKVAEVIARLGASASTFSDWWGYKMEVQDAIPENGALLHAAGVLTSFNSDSDELARRLHTEAAKAVRYGVLAALVVPQAGKGGLIAGTSALVQLDGWSWDDMSIEPAVALHVSLPEMRFNAALLPPPLDSRLAELRKLGASRLQALEDAFEHAAAYAKARASGDASRIDTRWEAMLPVLDGRRPVFVEADDMAQIRYALGFAERHHVRLVIVGGSDAWRLAEVLRERRVAVIIAGVHKLPQRRDDDYDTPYRLAARLAQAGVSFCIARDASGFETPNDRNLPYEAATAAAFGLDPAEALKAITLYPAQILGVADRLGSLEVGKLASFTVTDGDPLDIRTRVEKVYIQGREVDLANRQTRLAEKYREKYRQQAGPPK